MPRRSSSSAERRARGWFAVAALLLVPGLVDAQTEPARVALELIAPLDNSATIGFYIAPAAVDSGARDGDAELCRWALEDWVARAEGRLDVVPASEAEALIRVHFVAPGRGQYGEMRALEVGGRRGAAVYVRPDINALDPALAAAARADDLLRETIVYLTCLHELGHALGLEHTAEFADVMYYFGYGGDIPRFFGRYRDQLQTRDDIPRRSGLSVGDRARLLAAYPVP
jgi:hypothetical protein